MTLPDVLTQSVFPALRWAGSNVLVPAWVSVVASVIVWRIQQRRGLRFNMTAKIEPPNVHPRPQLAFRFLNTGKAPIHIERIEGDNGFTLGDYIDPFTVPVDPEPYEDDVAAPYVKILEKRPARIFAVDSTGKRWRLPRGDLKRVYRVLDAHEREAQATPESPPPPAPGPAPRRRHEWARSRREALNVVEKP